MYQLSTEQMAEAHLHAAEHCADKDPSHLPVQDPGSFYLKIAVATNQSVQRRPTYLNVSLYQCWAGVRAREDLSIDTLEEAKMMAI